MFETQDGQARLRYTLNMFKTLIHRVGRFPAYGAAAGAVLFPLVLLVPVAVNVMRDLFGPADPVTAIQTVQLSWCDQLIWLGFGVLNYATQGALIGAVIGAAVAVVPGAACAAVALGRLTCA
jgi:hypothetical protein